jgi:hypothetical protein
VGGRAGTLAVPELVDFNRCHIATTINFVIFIVEQTSTFAETGSTVEPSAIASLLHLSPAQH